ncbi:sigma-70 family RNA polymerase sigma factor [Aminipila butyrica]|uniref:Sigma-70 family RNA polymerase sigma factor n=1 Tax=Aminipila butyrica TaxID=433296 RepID=A0A858BXL1_9FIRM|nr:sigma-70 family RNA polymerase sigma factor [Aminipila butyrica]QIB69640.1 sigma-70 family RNA polymerase sigma factor [Aminipila butyrica]
MAICKDERYQALVGFIEDNQERMYRLAYSYVKNQATALDMVQEAVYKAIKAHQRLEDPEQVKAWFYKILVNTCLDELRRSRRLVATAPEQMPEEGEDSLDCKADHLVLQEALKELDADTKTVIVLRYFEDMKLTEIADLLETNINSVKSRLYRGLRLLKCQMGEGEVSHVE